MKRATRLPFMGEMQITGIKPGNKASQRYLCMATVNNMQSKLSHQRPTISAVIDAQWNLGLDMSILQLRVWPMCQVEQESVMEWKDLLVKPKIRLGSGGEWW